VDSSSSAYGHAAAVVASSIADLLDLASRACSDASWPVDFFTRCVSFLSCL
jgi:hypothetical protein